MQKLTVAVFNDLAWGEFRRGEGGEKSALTRSTLNKQIDLPISLPPCGVSKLPIPCQRGPGPVSGLFCLVSSLTVSPRSLCSL